MRRRICPILIPPTAPAPCHRSAKVGVHSKLRHGGPRIDVCLAPSSSRSFEPPPSFDRPVPWENSPFLEQSPASGSDRHDHDDSSRGYWRESPVTPAYSQFSIPSSTMSHHAR